MADLLGQFGPGSEQPQASRSGGGGVTRAKDVMRYAPPVGPKGINEPQTPGLHGVNNGTDQQPTQLQRGGAPGIMKGGGVNHGCCGSQGRY